MEIKAKTLTDRIYEHGLLISFFVLGVIALSTLGLMQYTDYTDKIQAKIDNQKNEAIKIETIKTNKPSLICNGKLLSPTQYDLTTIGMTNYIVTQAPVKAPDISVTVSKCQIYTNVTKSLVVVPKPIITYDMKLKKEKESLETSLFLANDQIKSLTINNKAHIETLKIANKSIIDLKLFISKQDIEIDRLVLIEARYKETEGLLNIILNKKSLNVADLRIKPKKIVKKVVVKESIKRVEPLVVKTRKTKAVIIADNTDHLQRILYTIRYLTQRMNEKSENIVPAPTKHDLTKFKISSGQLSNHNNVSKQLMQVIERLSISKTRALNIIDNRLRISIQENVGI